MTGLATCEESKKKSEIIRHVKYQWEFLPGCLKFKRTPNICVDRFIFRPKCIEFRILNINCILLPSMFETSRSIQEQIVFLEDRLKHLVWGPYPHQNAARIVFKRLP